MKTFSVTSLYVYWFLPILILSGEVLSSKGKLKLVKRVRNGPIVLHSAHLKHSSGTASLDCPGPNCKSNGVPEDKNRLKRNNNPFMNGGSPQWAPPNGPQYNQQQQFPQDNMMSDSQPHPVMDFGHFGPSGAPPNQPSFGEMPMARSDNGQGISGPADQFQNPSGPPIDPNQGNSNTFQGPFGPSGNPPIANNDFQGPPPNNDNSGIQNNPVIPFGPQQDPTGFQVNSQPQPQIPGQNQHQPRFGEPMGPTGFQENNNFNFQNDPSGQNFQPPQFNNQQNNIQPFPPNQFQNPTGPQFPQGNPPDQFGASSFQQQSFNTDSQPGFPLGDSNLQQQPQFPPQNQFPFPPAQQQDMNNNNNIPFPNQLNGNPNIQNFNNPPNFPQLNGGLPQGHPGGLPLVSFPNNNRPLLPFPNHLQPFPSNSSYAPRTNDDTTHNGDSDYNDGYDESETHVSSYHDDDYYDDYKHKGKHGLKHKGKVNEDQVVSVLVQIAWKVLSSYIFVFVANALIGFLGKAWGLNNSYMETHISLGNEGRHPFEHYGDKGYSSSYGSKGSTGLLGSGNKKGSYSLSNGYYHPAQALYQQPTYQYHAGGKDYALHGYDQHHAIKYAKKYSKKYAKKAGKYGLRPKPIGPYLPAYQYGLPPGPLALGWTAGSGGPNGFYKRRGSSAETTNDKKDTGKNKEKGSGRNGGGIGISRNSTTSESEEDEGENDNLTTSISYGNDTLSMTTLPTVETNTTLTNSNETSVENDTSSSVEDLESNSQSVEDDEADATTTLLPIVSDDENDIFKTSTTTATPTTPTITTTTTSAPKNESSDATNATDIRSRSNSRVSSLRT